MLKRFATPSISSSALLLLLPAICFLLLFLFVETTKGGSIVTTCQDCGVESFENFVRFTLQQKLPKGNYIGVTVADVNGDLYPDALVFREASPPLLYLNLADGTGSLNTSTIEPIAGFGSRGLLKDFDGDGFADILTSGRAIFWGDGTLHYDSKNILQWGEELGLTGLQVGAFVAYDFDGNGLLDILATSNNYQTADERSVILLNQGGRKFSLGPTFSGRATFSAALGDLDGNGIVDIVFAENTEDPSRAIFGVSRDPLVFKEGPVFQSPGKQADAAMVDFDRDGDLDVVLASRWNDQTTIWRNNGRGEFPLDDKIDLGAFRAWTVVAEDMNGDQWPDLVIGTGNYGTQVLLMNERGTFRPPVEFPKDAKDTVGRAIGVADFDANGSPDIFFANQRNGGGSKQSELWVSNCMCSQTVDSLYDFDEGMVAFPERFNRIVSPSSPGSSVSSSSEGWWFSSSSSSSSSSDDNNEESKEEQSVTTFTNTTPSFRVGPFNPNSNNNSSDSSFDFAESSSFNESAPTSAMSLNSFFLTISEVTPNNSLTIPERTLHIPTAGYSFFTYKKQGITRLAFQISGLHLSDNDDEEGEGEGISLFWEFILPKEDGTVLEGGVEFLLKANTTRWSMTVAGWPFLSPNNRLRVAVRLQGDRGHFYEAPDEDESSYEEAESDEEEEEVHGRSTNVLKTEGWKVMVSTSTYAAVGNSSLTNGNGEEERWRVDGVVSSWNADDQVIYFFVTLHNNTVEEGSDEEEDGEVESSSLSSSSSSSSSGETPPPPPKERPKYKGPKVTFDSFIKVGRDNKKGGDDGGNDGHSSSSEEDDGKLAQLLSTKSGDLTMILTIVLPTIAVVVIVAIVAGTIWLVRRRRVSRKKCVRQLTASMSSRPVSSAAQNPLFVN
ncbi:hypothetical protein QOT17_010806 [Balamuthia mandrillaris]